MIFSCKSGSAVGTNTEQCYVTTPPDGGWEGREVKSIHAENHT